MNVKHVRFGRGTSSREEALREYVHRYIQKNEERNKVSNLRLLGKIYDLKKKK